MTNNQQRKLRAMLHGTAHGLAVVVIYNFGFVFFAGVLFGIWLLFWTVVFKYWNE